MRGSSFKGQDLTGADFSHTDIRGANFKGAILKRANFATAKGGITKKSFAVYLLMILVLSALTGFLMAFCNVWIAWIVEGILKAFKANTNANIIIYTLLFSIVYVSASAILIRKGKYSITALAVAGAVAVAGALAVVGALALAVAGALAGAVAGVIAVAGAGVIAVAGAVAVATLIQLLLSVYIAYRTNKEDEQFDTYRKFGLSLSSLFGTNFDGADLTYANFNNANLKYCRFTKETVILRTGFKNAENLKFARMTGTILENKAIRELLISGNGKNQSFRELNLKGAYLVSADLSNADFHEADFIGATLENANLRDANLSRIQALGAEFRRADLTGACLESWNIDATTQLDGANADYVYLLSNKQERRPSSGIFGEGEFAKLFNEVIDTVDFIFRNGIDWQAFMICFDKLREKIRVESEDAEISIQSIANKGDGVFVVKVNVPLDADKAETHSNFKNEYETQLKLIEERYKAQLEAKDDLITVYREQNINLLDIIKYQAQRPLAVRNIRTEIHGNVNHSKVIAGDENEMN